MHLIEQRAESRRGYTFIEIAVVTAIVGILASAALPLAKVTMQRNREIELRRSLREIRTAIDKYKDAVDQNLIAESALDGSTDGYPPTLETLVEGVPACERQGEEAAVSSPHPLRSDDAIDRVGAALDARHTGVEIVGRPERLRCVYEV